jgi:hypothetical protein
MTDEVLGSLDLLPNIMLRNMAREYKAGQPSGAT